MNIKVGDTFRIKAGVWGEILAEVDMINEEHQPTPSVRVVVQSEPHVGHEGWWDIADVVEVLEK